LKAITGIDVVESRTVRATHPANFAEDYQNWESPRKFAKICHAKTSALPLKMKKAFFK